METDGTVYTLDTGFKVANGMGFSIDRKTLYVTDSAERRIYAYDYDARTGNATRRRILVQVPSEEGLPDGLTVDAQGFIWSAQWFGGCLCRYDLDGRIERRIGIPAEQTSSLTFGGPDLTDIFVSSAATPDALALVPPAYRSTGNVGGQLFHLNLGIQGKAEFRSRIQCASEDNSNEQSQP
ncbi:MAG: SMP-30/gluconolactonase/LRE family protein [Acidobacteriota bacterium]|nr:SMP-30/gluconolactonase/LRE family protein [Acidobacteriota bacterium]